MSVTVSKATKFFHSYGVKCHDSLVEEWLNSISATKDLSSNFCEDDLYDFNEWCRWKGTAYEEGINDQTKIARLLEEINELKSEIVALQKKKEDLESKLGVIPF